MSEYDFSNLWVFDQTTDPAGITDALLKRGVMVFHATNGIFAWNGKDLVPRQLAQAEYIADFYANKGEPLLVAINSNESVALIDEEQKRLLEQKYLFAAGDEEIAKVELEYQALERRIASAEDQHVRARKVGEPLALQHPDNPIIIVFYDGVTPNELYEELLANFSVPVLYKYGYVPGKDGKPHPKIEGGERVKECGGDVVGFEPVGGKDPAAKDVTAKANQAGIVEVIDLTEAQGRRKKAYITHDAQILFDLKPQVQRYLMDKYGIGMPAPGGGKAPGGQGAVPPAPSLL